MANTNITIELHYTKLNRKPDMRNNGFPLSGNTLMLSDWYRENGYTAHKDGNLLVISQAGMNLWSMLCPMTSMVFSTAWNAPLWTT